MYAPVSYSSTVVCTVWECDSIALCDQINDSRYHVLNTLFELPGVTCVTCVW